MTLGGNGSRRPHRSPESPPSRCREVETSWTDGKRLARRRHGGGSRPISEIPAQRDMTRPTVLVFTIALLLALVPTVAAQTQEHKEVAIDKNILDGYVGRYQMM